MTGLPLINAIIIIINAGPPDGDPSGTDGPYGFYHAVLSDALLASI